jgi:peroxiredoxin
MSGPSLMEELDACTRRCQGMDAPLADRLGALADDVRRLSPAFAEVVDRMVARLERSGAGGSAPEVGTALLPFLLPDETGRLTTLDELLGGGSLVVAFHRGHWCPYCRIEASALAKAETEVEREGGRIVLITPETQAYSRRLKADSGGRFRILTDLDSGYALDLGLAIKINDEKRQAMTMAGWDIAEFHANDNWILPIPATFVLDRTGRIAGRFVDPDYRRRMDIDEMLAAVRQAAAVVSPAA